MAITGTLLVVETGGMRRFEQLWLTISLVLYVIALLIVFLAQRPALTKVIELTSGPPAPGGPPAEVPALLRRLRLLGYVLLAPGHRHRGADGLEAGPLAAGPRSPVPRARLLRGWSRPSSSSRAERRR